jgi:multiple sugar transport system permease protein
MTTLQTSPPRSDTSAPGTPPTPRRPMSVGARVVRWVRRGGVGTLVVFLPLLLCFGYFAWWPILQTMLLSVQQNNLIDDPVWVGTLNFERVLADPLLATAIGNTLLFAGLSLLIGFPLPIILATLMAELRRTRRIVSVLAYLPVIIPPVVSVLLWKQFYEPGPDGVFNTILGGVGVAPLPWLQDGNSAMLSIVIQATWAGFGQTAIIYLAALMSVQPELYEAAEVDGARVLRRFWHITLPQMRGVILLMLLLQIIGVLQVFTEPFVMTGGGPENRTVTVLMLIYRYAFIYGDYGMATALSLMLAAVLGLVSAVYLRATRRWSTT